MFFKSSCCLLFTHFCLHVYRQLSTGLKYVYAGDHGKKIVKSVSFSIILSVYIAIAMLLCTFLRHLPT